jgi:superfamily II DNA or RNA helicase
MNREEVQKEALKATEGKKRSSIVLGTGVGKTLVGLMHIQKNFSPLISILVVAPKRSIIAEWRAQAIKFNMEKLLDNVTFTTYLSLNKHDPREYDHVYLDECHNLLSGHCAFLNEYNGGILGMTGTPPGRNSVEKARMVNEFCPIVYTFNADDAVEAGILNDYKIVVHLLDLSSKNDFPVTTKKGTFYTSEQKNYDYWTTRVSAEENYMVRIMRMKAMMDYRSKEKYSKVLMSSIDSKCIVFANTQDQADRLCNYSYHSNNSDSEDNLQAFKNGSIDKLSCVLQLNEGVNIPNLKQGIILHAYSNERKSSQRIGRLLRLNPDDRAIIHILCYRDTIDQKWVETSLEGFDESKILWKDFEVQLD